MSALIQLPPSLSGQKTRTLNSSKGDWQWSPPVQQSVDPVALATVFDDATRFSPIRSLLVARNGFLIGEYYSEIGDAHAAHNIYSISKSILSLLIGIALRERWIESIDQSIEVWLPDYFDANTDARKKSITIRHLITLSAGLGWIENEPSLQRWRKSPDWVKAAIDLPIVALPGKQFNYNTTLTHVLSVILARASGMSTRELAERYLFGPVGIEVADWKTDPQGIHRGGSDVYLRPTDLLTLGQLVLDLGVWRGKQVVPTDWIRQATQPQIALRQGGFWHPAYKDYGYLFWLRNMQSYETVVLSGYAGQLIFIVRRLNLVMVIAADDTIPYAGVMKQSHLIEGFVEDLIIPAVQEKNTHGSSYR